MGLPLRRCKTWRHVSLQTAPCSSMSILLCSCWIEWLASTAQQHHSALSCCARKLPGLPGLLQAQVIHLPVQVLQAAHGPLLPELEITPIGTRRPRSQAGLNCNDKLASFDASLHAIRRRQSRLASAGIGMTPPVHADKRCRTQGIEKQLPPMQSDKHAGAGACLGSPRAWRDHFHGKSSCGLILPQEHGLSELTLVNLQPAGPHSACSSSTTQHKPMSGADLMMFGSPLFAASKASQAARQTDPISPRQTNASPAAARHFPTDLSMPHSYRARRRFACTYDMRPKVAKMGPSVPRC